MRRHTLLILLLFPVSRAPGQEQPLVADTLASPPSDTSSVGGVDTLVAYSARDSIVYSMNTRLMNLYGDGATAYEQMTLTAELIDVNWDTATLTAVGVRDSARSDSVIGRPYIKESGDEYYGEQVSYNFRSKRGRITLATTEMDEGYYRGEQIKKMDVGMLYVADGRYTTCDLEHPHFYFTSPRMKLYVRDKVIAEPVYFYVADVPVMALPFGIFPSRGGRASGIIAPAFGEDSRLGSYLSHLGYYWAASDYFDISTLFDLSTRGGWANRTRVNYGLRYSFNGSLSGEYRRFLINAPGDPDFQSRTSYDVALSHSQRIDPTANIVANVRFASSNFREYSQSLEDILRQNIFSAASFTKRWDESNRSLSVGFTRDQSLTNGDIREVLPTISFTQTQIFPFRPRTTSRGTSASFSSERPWLHMLGLSYGATYSNQRTKLTTLLPSVRLDPLAPIDTAEVYGRGRAQSLGQNLGFSISPRVGHITITPSLGFSDARSWTTDDSPSRNPADSTLVFLHKEQQTISGTLRSGIAATTRFYGLAQPGVFGVEALRHTVNPSLSLSYGKQVYWRNPSPIPKYQLVASMNVANNFEMKLKTVDSLDAQKIQLLNLGFGLAYDFARDSLNFTELSINYRTDVAGIFTVAGGASYNLYEFDRTIGRRVNKYLLSSAGKLGELTSVSLSMSTSLRGKTKSAGGTTQGIPGRVQQEQAESEGPSPESPQRPTYQTIYDREEADFSIPWNLTLSWTFSQSQADPRVKFRNSSANASLSFNITEKWQVGTSASYDLVRKKHFVPSVDVTRDLHCWTMRFTWYPMGLREGYRLELRVKAPQLQDIKVTKQSSARGVYN